MMEALWKVPNTWAWSTLGEMASWSSGGTPKATEKRYYGGDIPWLVIGDLNDGVVKCSTKSITPLGLHNSSCKFVEPGAIMIAMYGSIGKLGIAGLRCTTNQAIAFTRLVSGGVGKDFLFHYLMAVRNRLLETGKGGAQANISQTVLKAFPVCIAPLPEQRRIEAKLEKLLGEVDACQKHLARACVFLKRFRQSVLAAACSGRLTADWREENQAGSVDRIPIDSDSGLPESWKSVCVGEVIESLKYGTAQKCEYKQSGVPVLRIPNVANGTIDHSDLKYAQLPTREIENLQLRPGDVLLIRSNGSVSLVGKCALVREPERGFAYAGYLIRIRPLRTLITPEFLNMTLGSYNVRLQIELEARSTSGVNNINSDEVRALHMSLPPLGEQQEIVRRIDGLFALADQIEIGYTKAKAHVDRLTPSVLGKAFRGELVRQDPNDEPASVLLEKIKSDPKANGSPKRRSEAIYDRENSACTNTGGLEA